MTNEQALGRALELLMQVSGLDGSLEVCREGVYTATMLKEIMSDIDKFLDSEFRREG